MSNIENDGAVFAWNPKNPRGWGYGSPIPGVTPTEDNPWGANANQQQRTNYELTGNINNSGVPVQTSQNNSGFDMASLIAALSSNRSGSGSGSGAADKLARDKFEYEKRKDALQRAQDLETTNLARVKDARILGGFQNYYGGGEGDFNKGFNNLLDMIKTQGEESEGGITKAYDRATTNIGEGYDAASGLGTSGFNALNQYLAQNQNNPYAGMRASVGSAPDALSSYLSAYGVSDQPVQGQIQADQLQAQQGAGNYQNLIDLLGATAQQGAASRGAESQMAQLLFNTGLGQERAGYEGQAANAQAQALAALQQQMFQSRFGVEGDRNSLANQLVQTILNVGGDIDGGSGSGDDESAARLAAEEEARRLAASQPLPGQLPQTASPQEIVANQLANLLAPAQAQGSTAQQLLNELNARRGR